MTDVREINVEEIMAQIREGIARRRAAGDDPRETVAVPPPSRNHIVAEMATLQASSDIYNVPLTSHRRALGPFTVFVKRILRQLLTPILSRQVEYNAGNARILARLAEHVDALRQDLGRIRDEIARGQAQELQAVHERLDALDGEQARLRNDVVASGLQAVHDRLDELDREHARLRNDVVEPGLKALSDRVEALGLEQARVRKRGGGAGAAGARRPDRGARDRASTAARRGDGAGTARAP